MQDRGRAKEKNLLEKQRTIGEGVVAHVVARTVCVDEHQNSDIGRAIWRARICCCLRVLHADGPRNVAQQQGRRAQQVHDAPPHLDHQHGHHRRAHQAPARNAHVDLLDGRAVGEADHVEQVAKVVRDERVAAPLREEAEHHGDEDAAAHAGGGDEGYP